MSEINNLSRQIYFINLTYYFNNKIIRPINSTGFKAPLHFYRDIFDDIIQLPKAEDQKNFKVDLNKITRGNPKKKSEDQIKTRKNI